MISVFVAMIAVACLFVLFGLASGGLRGGCAGCGCGRGVCVKRTEGEGLPEHGDDL
ncbi:MAG TPA: hypothetical protein VNL98_07900 [Gemmatimonadales bacterium]|nr:hypothetical protein [Gemmatimonadales bacterium]